MFGLNSHPLHARRARAAILSSRWTTREKKTQAPSFSSAHNSPTKPSTGTKTGSRVELIKCASTREGFCRHFEDVWVPLSRFLMTVTDKLYQLNSPKLSLSWALARERSRTASSCVVQRNASELWCALPPLTGPESKRAPRRHTHRSGTQCPHLVEFGQIL